MNDSQKSPLPDTRILEFAEIIAPKDGSASPVVVGGHAVNLWSEHYFAVGVKALAAYMPFTSKDLSEGKISRWLHHRFPSGVA